jgi:hypothetical protein
MADIYHYKIRNKRTGLFKLGSSQVYWSKNGKTWTSLGALMSHLSMYKRIVTFQNNKVEQYTIGDEWEVVTIVINPNADAVNIVDFLSNRKPDAIINNNPQYNG